MKKFSPQFLLGVTFLAALAFVVYAETEKPQPKEEKVLEKKTDELPVLTPSSFWIGVRVVPVPDILLSHFGVKDEKAGLVVLEQVIEDGPAAKAGLKRGDVVLSFGGKDVHTLQDIVRQVGDAKETEQKMTVIRNGQKTDVTITPAPRPHEPMMMSRQPGFQGRRMPLMQAPGMRMGPDIWLGSRDPQEMMREMEDYFRQMQGGLDGDQFVVLSDEEAMADGTANKLEVTSKTDQDGKSTIHVRQWTQNGDKIEEKTWEADNVDNLPEEIRADVQKLFGK